MQELELKRESDLSLSAVSETLEDNDPSIGPARKITSTNVLYTKIDEQK
jgi:hypothetical protein